MRGIKKRKKGRYEKVQKNPCFLLLIVVAVILIVLLLFLLKGCIGNQHAEEGLLGTSTVETVKNPDLISIPGYEMLELKADSKKQSVQMENPAVNTCVFQISLLLEDGTLLWESEDILPGEISAPIVLKQKLEEGTYSNAVLVYKCFTTDRERTQLNGAELKLTLWVK